MDAHITPEYAAENKGPGILAAFWITTTIALVTVMGRFYIRMRVLRSVGVDDWLILLSMIASLSYAIMTTVNVNLGYGRHADVIPERLSLVLLLNLVDFSLGILSFCLPKLAVVALLNRLFTVSKAHRIMLWGLSGLVSAVSIVCVFILWFTCNPARAQWQMEMVEEGKATCFDRWILVHYAIFNGALSAFCDLVIALYPALHVMGLKMDLGKKLALCAALGLGCVSAAMAIVKCFQLPGLANSKDPTYGTADLVIWTSVEGNSIIIASCIPTLRPLLEVLMGRKPFGSTSGQRYKGSGAQATNWSSGRRLGRSRQEELPSTAVESQESILRTETDPVEGYRMDALPGKH